MDLFMNKLDDLIWQTSILLIVRVSITTFLQKVFLSHSNKITFIIFSCPTTRYPVCTIHNNYDSKSSSNCSFIINLVSSSLICTSNGKVIIWWHINVVTNSLDRPLKVSLFVQVVHIYLHLLVTSFCQSF